MNECQQGVHWFRIPDLDLVRQTMGTTCPHDETPTHRGAPIVMLNSFKATFNLITE